MIVYADFRADLIKHCRDALQQNGFTVDTSGTFKNRKRVGAFEPWHWIIHYANAELRMIANVPRSVLKAQKFACPPNDANGLALFLEKVEAGEPLRPHLSRLSSKADFTDGLLSDWGIQHFHLGTTVDPDGMMKRTSNVLFALVTRDKFHCISILPHEDNAGDPIWAHKLLMETVRDNWPELIAPFKMNVLMSGEEASASGTRQLRAAGITQALPIGGDVYLSPGGGFVTSGNSGRAAKKAMHYRRTARDLEKLVRRLAPDISRGLAEARGKDELSWIEFRLLVTPGAFYAIETRSGLAVAYRR